MGDFKREYYQTIRDRKSMAISSRKKKIGTKSKKCTLPSDHLTRKEWMAMNGEVKSYHIGEPVDFITFSSQYPTNIQQEVINYLQDTFQVTPKMLAKMWELNCGDLIGYFKKNGISVRRTYPSAADTKRLAAWYNKIPIVEIPPRMSFDHFNDLEPMEAIRYVNCFRNLFDMSMSGFGILMDTNIHRIQKKFTALGIHEGNNRRRHMNNNQKTCFTKYLEGTITEEDILSLMVIDHETKTGIASMEGTVIAPYSGTIHLEGNINEIIQMITKAIPENSNVTLDVTF